MRPLAPVAALTLLFLGSVSPQSALHGSADESSEPSYCWLTFGPDGGPRYLVRYDGEAISFERHKAGKAVGAVERFAHLQDFKPVTIDDPDGKTSYIIQTVSNIAYVKDLGRGLAIEVEVRGPVGYWQGAQIRLGEKAEGAASVAFHAALAIDDYKYGKASPDRKVEWKAHIIHPLVTGDKPTTLNAQVQNKKMEKDCHVVVESTDDSGVKSRFPKDIRPVAEIEFPPAKPGDPVVRRRFELDQVCCGSNFYAPIAVPKEAGVGTAKVTFTFDAWKDGRVAPTTIEIPVVEPPPAKK
jgi:hypothetical protein